MSSPIQMWRMLIQILVCLAHINSDIMAEKDTSHRLDNPALSKLLLASSNCPSDR